MPGKGQEDQLPPRRASDRCSFGERTFPETRGNDEVAPIPDVPGLTPERRGSNPKRKFDLRPRGYGSGRERSGFEAPSA
jgi:hypothetical protein